MLTENQIGAAADEILLGKTKTHLKDYNEQKIAHPPPSAADHDKSHLQA